MKKILWLLLVVSVWFVFPVYAENDFERMHNATYVGTIDPASPAECKLPRDSVWLMRVATKDGGILQSAFHGTKSIDFSEYDDTFEITDSQPQFHYGTRDGRAYKFLELRMTFMHCTIVYVDSGAIPYLLEGADMLDKFYSP